MSPQPNYLVLLIPLLIGIVFLALGVVFLWITINARRKASQAQTWVPTAGRVISATLREHTHYDSDNAPSSTYEPVIQYEYQVMGRPYLSTRVAFGATSFGHQQAAEAVARYTPGSPVTVYYNPNNPAEAVIERQSRGSVLFIVAGILFALIGLAACCASAALAFFMQAPQ